MLTVLEADPPALEVTVTDVGADETLFWYV